ncbi:hypothetical protein P153DRAFT_209438 [Dothidotthia symphoricarpi CBS 119687]|uniref:DUF7514 domain-containing protein n=1 Tax=Dothidotthia symphoricarpi CBS 119687 TaxID=1392245 RepID=A0A6A6AIX3_9PLEO|nr:uncharacterized protein P153DRAFT_209438 [Dothidotthia symphoricarpi CBS 119687]KAF2131045.1 hypothetical protein P153DRAFT_209438 [Dothidotthia symphoricarpi CBS 119687]
MAAYDDYRQPDPHAYPDDDFVHDWRTHKPSAYSHDQQTPTQSHGRVGSASNAPSHQPLNNAIGNAFEKSDAARVVDPDLIAQITAEVKKSVLDEIKQGIAGATQPQPVPAQSHHVAHSPVSTSASIPSQNAHTPPSPQYAEHYSQAYTAPEPLFRDPLFDGSDDTPYKRSAPVDVPPSRPSARPAPMTRMATADCTPIERMWQLLFDSDGQPMPRLGEFLRGLALHLIEDYEPKHSLVISPAKMARFYEEVNLQDEIYPWQTIFMKLPYATLSKVYREMRCQHHLIQEHPAEQPIVPALTPQGFQEWMTIMLQAYPDVEYARLSKAVLDMPISNADDRRERFPKELPRRLFPRTENLHAQQRCAAALSAEGVGPLHKAPTFPPPPPKAQSPPNVPNIERERSPYVTRPDSKVYQPEDGLQSPSVPIERQRQPYSAAPGGGKTYDDDDAYRATSASGQRRRTHSIANQGPWAPPPDNTYQQHQPQRAHNGSQANTRRPKSPSFSNYGTHSDSNVRDIPSSYYSSNMHDSDEETRRSNKDADSRRSDYHRRSTAGMDSPFNSQSRSTYDDEYHRSRDGSNGYDNRGYDSRRY